MSPGLIYSFSTAFAVILNRWLFVRAAFVIIHSHSPALPGFRVASAMKNTDIRYAGREPLGRTITTFKADFYESFFPGERHFYWIVRKFSLPANLSGLSVSFITIYFYYSLLRRFFLLSFNPFLLNTIHPPSKSFFIFLRYISSNRKLGKFIWYIRLIANFLRIFPRNAQISRS